MMDKLRPFFGEPIAPWKRWFAWRPVWTVDWGVVWLRFVERRHIHKHHWLDGGPDYWWQHRLPVDEKEPKP